MRKTPQISPLIPCLFDTAVMFPNGIPAQPSGEKIKSSKECGDKTYVNCASIYPDRVYTYSRPIDGFNYSKKFDENKKNLKCNKTNGNMSDKARKNIEAGINWLLYRSKLQYAYSEKSRKKFGFRINFITLTLPCTQFHTDREIVSVCLNNFLNTIRNVAGVKDYVWKAEAQLNGNIHFHITTNKFMYYKDVRKWWNQSIELLGYVSKFEEKWKHRNPPTEEIRSVKHVKRIASYVSKYLSKDKLFVPIGELRESNGKRFEVLYNSKQYRSESVGKKLGRVVGAVIAGPVRRLDCKLWFCSRSISQHKPLIIDNTCFQWCSLEDILKDVEVRRYEGKYVTGHFFNVPKLSKHHDSYFAHSFDTHAKGEVVDFGVDGYRKHKGLFVDV